MTSVLTIGSCWNRAWPSSTKTFLCHFYSVTASAFSLTHHDSIVAACYCQDQDNHTTITVLLTYHNSMLSHLASAVAVVVFSGGGTGGSGGGNCPRAPEERGRRRRARRGSIFWGGWFCCNVIIYLLLLKIVHEVHKIWREKTRCFITATCPLVSGHSLSLANRYLRLTTDWVCHAQR